MSYMYLVYSEVERPYSFITTNIKIFHNVDLAKELRFTLNAARTEKEIDDGLIYLIVPIELGD